MNATGGEVWDSCNETCALVRGALHSLRFCPADCGAGSTLGVDAVYLFVATLPAALQLCLQPAVELVLPLALLLSVCLFCRESCFMRPTTMSTKRFWTAAVGCSASSLLEKMVCSLLSACVLRTLCSKCSSFVEYSNRHGERRCVSAHQHHCGNCRVHCRSLERLGQSQAHVLQLQALLRSG